MAHSDSESQEGKKPIKLNLEMCYSGFTIEELEYIDYTRTIVEEESSEKSLSSTQEFEKRLPNTGADEDPLGNETYYEDCTKYTSASEELRSYLCSTPTPRRKCKSEYFSPDVELSRITDIDVEFGRHRHSHGNSTVSLFDERGSIRGSMDSLYLHDGDVFEDNRRKIVLDSDLKDPYCNVDEFELSIEEEYPEMPQKTSAMGSLRRKMSTKLSRRNSGIFGSYLQRNQTTPSQAQATNGGFRFGVNNNSNRNQGQGPINFWFRKFRSRHFI